MRVVKFVVNWLFILTVPFWFVPFFIGIVILGINGVKQYREFADIGTGKTWII